MTKLHIDDVVIDDLVCGNLHGDSYRSALRALEAEPQRWRDCALAFLQEQALSQELTSLARQDVDWGYMSSKPEAASSKIARESPQSTPPCQSSLPNKKYERLQRMHRFTSLAAMLLVSFTIGWFGAGLQLGDSLPQGDQVSTGRKVAGGGAGGEATGGLIGRSSADQVVQNDVLIPETPRRANDFLAGGGMQFADGAFAPIDRAMPEWLRELERIGSVRIDSYEALMPMNLDDGTSAIVPVQQYRVKPVVYSY